MTFPGEIRRRTGLRAMAGFGAIECVAMRRLRASICGRARAIRSEKGVERRSPATSEAAPSRCARFFSLRGFDGGEENGQQSDDGKESADAIDEFDSGEIGELAQCGGADASHAEG